MKTHALFVAALISAQFLGCGKTDVETEAIRTSMKKYFMEETSGFERVDIVNICIYKDSAMGTSIPFPEHDHATVFAQNKNGSWIGVLYGTWFDDSDLEEIGFPMSEVIKCREKYANSTKN